MKQKDYHAKQRRKDDEHLFEESRKPGNEQQYPWLVLPHDSREIFESVLRGLLEPIIREEVARAIGDVLGSVIKPPKVEASERLLNKQELEVEISGRLSQRLYKKTNKWTRRMDEELCLKVLTEYGSVRKLYMIYEEFGNKYGFTTKAVSLRWLELKHLMEGLIYGGH